MLYWDKIWVISKRQWCQQNGAILDSPVYQAWHLDSWEFGDNSSYVQYYCNIEWAFQGTVLYSAVECNVLQYMCSVLNRPGVAGAVLQSPPSFADWLINSVILYSKYLPNTPNPKPEEIGSWNFERMFIWYYVSCVKCHVSCVTCHVSRVTCHMSKKVTYFL